MSLSSSRAAFSKTKLLIFVQDEEWNDFSYHTDEPDFSGLPDV